MNYVVEWVFAFLLTFTLPEYSFIIFYGLEHFIDSSEVSQVHTVIKCGNTLSQINEPAPIYSSRSPT